MSSVFKASQILQRTRVVLQLERLLPALKRAMLYHEFLEVELRRPRDEDFVNGSPPDGLEASKRLYITIDHDCGRAETGAEGAVLGEEEDKPQARQAAQAERLNGYTCARSLMLNRRSICQDVPY